MDELRNLLKRTDLFSGFPDEVLLTDILPHGQLQEYRKGQFLIEPQQCFDRFAVVLSGKIHIMHIFPEGNYSLMSALTAGDLLGADLICTRTQISPYHAIAAAPSRVVYFPAALLTEPGCLREVWRQEALNRLLRLISTENMKKEYRLAILSQKGLRERILTYLTMQSARLRKTTFAISFSREELAAFLCVNRSALSHELSRMQQEGILRFHKNVFTLETPSDSRLRSGILEGP
ncbi:MAG: Crp/Fnr family transcriptional regulator [Faecousia sp.]